MKKSLVFIISSIILLPTPFMGAAMKLDHTMPEPDRQDITLKPDSDSFKLRTLANKQQWEEFYIQAQAILDQYYQTKLEDKREDNFFDCLWSLYYMAAAPLINLDTPERIRWMSLRGCPDFKVKRRVLALIFSLSSPARGKLPVKARDLNTLALSWYIKNFKHFRDIYSPGFDKDMTKRICFKDKNPGQIEPDLSSSEYDQKETLLSLRNNKIEGNMDLFEHLFIKMLLNIYPNQPGAIKKQLHLAGYTDRQIPAMLNKSVGRTARTEFLYKALKIKPPKPEAAKP